MKLAFTFCFLVVVPWVKSEQQLLKKYEYVNVDSLLKNTRALNNYISCILGRGVCTPQGLDLKGKYSSSIITIHMFT